MERATVNLIKFYKQLSRKGGSPASTSYSCAVEFSIFQQRSQTTYFVSNRELFKCCAVANFRFSTRRTTVASTAKLTVCADEATLIRLKFWQSKVFWVHVGQIAAVYCWARGRSVEIYRFSRGQAFLHVWGQHSGFQRATRSTKYATFFLLKVANRV